jgi:hypothetical protein
MGVTVGRDLTALGQRAREHLLRRHAPRRCGQQYHEAIETAYRKADATTRGAINSIGRSASGLTEADLAQISACLAQNGAKPVALQFLVDISGVFASDSKGRIPLTFRGLLLELLRRPPAGFRVEPVHAHTTADGYRYARRWTMNLLGVPSEGFEDELVDTHVGDVFLALYPNHRVSSGQAALYRRWRNLGVRTAFLIDALPPMRVPPPEGGKRLFWVAEASDGDIGQLRDACDCLIEANDAEGVGLPAMEATRQRLAIIARDIRASRDVASEGVLYFSSQAPEDLEQAVSKWLASRTPLLPAAQGAARRPLTDAESADMLVHALGLPARQSDPADGDAGG